MVKIICQHLFALARYRKKKPQVETWGASYLMAGQTRINYSGWACWIFGNWTPAAHIQAGAARAMINRLGS